MDLSTACLLANFLDKTRQWAYTRVARRPDSIGTPLADAKYQVECWRTEPRKLHGLPIIKAGKVYTTVPEFAEGKI
jgi:hypothetical protein